MRNRPLSLLRCVCMLLMLFLIAVPLCGCGANPVTVPSAAPETTTAPVTTPASTPAPAPTPNPYDFPRLRTDYRLDLTDEGTAVIDRESGETTVVPFGEKMFFKGEMKYSKDTDFIIHHVRSHAETYITMDESAVLPVDFLRTTAYWTWNGKTARECLDERFNTPWRFPDQKDKVIVGYVNAMEYSGVDRWDPSFDPAWDKDGDAIIDNDASPLPDYVDTRTFKTGFRTYVAKYWTDSWREELKRDIDATAAQHFDGIMLDTMLAYSTWAQADPSLTLETYIQRNVELIKWISDYAKERYGSAFVITGNFNPDTEFFKYFPDLSDYMDGGYYQNAFFRWEGSGIIDGYGRSFSEKRFENPYIDFMVSQGLSVLDMDHLGTGVIPEGLDFADYNDRITEEKLLALFRWAIDSGSTPFVIEVFMAQPYKLVPRFSRVYEDLPPFSDTPYADWVLGSEAHDVIPTGAGDDMVYGGPGDDQIDGGQGDDAAYYTGQRKDYEVVREDENVIVTARKGDEGRDMLVNIERLIFLDMTETIH
ncbi:MAG: hypothetical protein BWY11_02516 [Firmicutes bacterium ADurb.Bin182]|nr:MAG: hypothetical protein BWY11_02516 [Firmicutes bacterium ADurb.Bin182]